MRKVSLLPALILVLSGDLMAAGLNCPATPAYPKALQSKPFQHNDIPPRLQWDANYGYCGETSFISAGLYYGQYISQYDARSLAMPDIAQKEITSQLLLGQNDVETARRMHLNAKDLSTTNSTTFLSSVKKNVVAGYPVAIGVYENKSIWNQETPEPQYDHIVTVVGIKSKFNLNDKVYHSNDQIVFSDNGEYTDNNDKPTFYFSYPFNSFLKSRTQANQGSDVYSLTKSAENNGIVFTGVTDLKHETVPVKLTVDVNCEANVMPDHTSDRPESTPLTLTVTVSKLSNKSNYVLYEYDSMDNVPDEDFNAHADAAKYSCSIPVSSPSFVTKQAIDSNQMAIFRAVKASNEPSDIPVCEPVLPQV